MARLLIAGGSETRGRERPFTRKALVAELGVPTELADQTISNAVQAGYLRCVEFSGPIPRYAVESPAD